MMDSEEFFKVVGVTKTHRLIVKEKLEAAMPKGSVSDQLDVGHLADLAISTFVGMTKDIDNLSGEQRVLRQALKGREQMLAMGVPGLLQDLRNKANKAGEDRQAPDKPQWWYTHATVSQQCFNEAANLLERYLEGLSDRGDSIGVVSTATAPNIRELMARYSTPKVESEPTLVTEGYRLVDQLVAKLIELSDNARYGLLKYSANGEASDAFKEAAQLAYGLKSAFLVVLDSGEGEDFADSLTKLAEDTDQARQKEPGHDGLMMAGKAVAYREIANMIRVRDVSGRSAKDTIQGLEDKVLELQGKLEESEDNYYSMRRSYEGELAKNKSLSERAKRDSEMALESIRRLMVAAGKDPNVAV